MVLYRPTTSRQNGMLQLYFQSLNIIFIVTIITIFLAPPTRAVPGSPARRKPWIKIERPPSSYTLQCRNHKPPVPVYTYYSNFDEGNPTLSRLQKVQSDAVQSLFRNDNIFPSLLGETQLANICSDGPFYIYLKMNRKYFLTTITYELRSLGGYCVEPYGGLVFDAINDLHSERPTVESEWDGGTVSPSSDDGKLAEYLHQRLAQLVQLYDAEGEIPTGQYQATTINPFLASKVEQWLREMGHGSIGNRIVQMQNDLDEVLRPPQEVWDFVRETRSHLQRICLQQCRCENAGGASWLEMVGAIRKAHGPNLMQAFSYAAARAQGTKQSTNIKQAYGDGGYKYPVRQIPTALDTLEGLSSNPALTTYRDARNAAREQQRAREEYLLGKTSCKTALDCSDEERCVARPIENSLVLGVSSVTTWAAACALLPTISKTRLGGRNEDSIPSIGSVDEDDSLAESLDWSCPCNETYVSDACCHSDSGMVDEALEFKRGVLFR